MGKQPRNWLQDLDIAIEVLCPCLALIFTSLRVYSRWKTKAFGWDDACIIVAMLLSIALSIGTVLYMKYLYVGIPAKEVPQENVKLREGMIWIYVTGSIYNPILAIVKQSVLLFLLRLASVKPGIRFIIWATAIFNAALMISTLLTVIFQCTPVALNWDFTLQGSCINKVAFAVSTACLTIVTDIIVLALPFHIFLNLQIDKKKKVALIGVFFLGFIVTAVGVVRLYFLWPQFGLIKVPDPNYSFSFCIATIEVNLAIIAASGPALWPLLRALMPRLMTSMKRTTNGYHQSHDTDRTPDQAFRDNHIVKGGGSQIGLKSLTESRALSRTAERDSDEEFLTHNGEGIHRVIQISVTHEDNYCSGTSSRGATTSSSNIPY